MAFNPLPTKSSCSANFLIGLLIASAAGRMAFLTTGATIGVAAFVTTRPPIPTAFNASGSMAVAPPASSAKLSLLAIRACAFSLPSRPIVSSVCVGPA